MVSSGQPGHGVEMPSSPAPDSYIERRVKTAPTPFADIGKRVKDLLTKDYNFDNKLILTIPNDSGMLVTATGATKDQIFVGDISTHYKSASTIVNVKVDTSSNVSTTVTVNDIFPFTKAALSFSIPDHKSGKLDVEYLHHHATINTTIGLTPSPHFQLAATLGTKQLSLGAELAFDASTASFTKCNTGFAFNYPDLCAALMLTNKGDLLKLSFTQRVNQENNANVAAELTHNLTTYENTFMFGSSIVVDSKTLVKTRVSSSGRVGMVWQREWREKSLVSVSGEYDSKAVNVAPRVGLSLALVA